MVSTPTMRESSPRKCSSNGQQNSKTGVRLFGVRIDIDPQSKIKKKGGEFIRKSKSLGNLELFGSSSAVAHDHRAATDDGYHSDGIIQTSKNRKKGTLWSREEHRSFLVGLEKLGKGDWKGISKTYVPSRTPSQVASHAQKYFIRKATKDKRKRRSSVFDVDLNDSNSCVPPSQASPSLPSISNNDPEVLKEAGVSVSPVEQQLVDTKESKGQASKMAPSATHERPPISPMSRPFGVTDLRHMSNSMGVPRNIHGFTSNKGLPTFSWVPVFNYHNPNQINIVPNFSGPCFAPYVARPSTGVSRQTPP